MSFSFDLHMPERPVPGVTMVQGDITDDVAQSALIASVTPEAAGEAFSIGSGEPCSLRDAAERRLLREHRRGCGNDARGMREVSESLVVREALKDGCVLIEIPVFPLVIDEIGL
ncbi:MAG: hypothetical protein Q8K99_05245 [Actinomycetota bacterium]|nr:hypothetical protein [Actinomycetota bacterium]